jgi:hypothetical protein
MPLKLDWHTPKPVPYNLNKQEESVSFQKHRFIILEENTRQMSEITAKVKEALENSWKIKFTKESIHKKHESQIKVL